MKRWIEDWKASEKRNLKFLIPLLFSGILLMVLGVEFWSPLAVAGFIIVIIGAIFYYVPSMFP